MGANVKGKDCLIVEEVIKDGSKLAERAKDLKNMGANRVILFSIHALFVGNNLKDLHESEIDEILVTDSIFNQDTFY